MRDERNTVRRAPVYVRAVRYASQVHDRLDERCILRTAVHAVGKSRLHWPMDTVKGRDGIRTLRALLCVWGGEPFSL